PLAPWPLGPFGPLAPPSAEDARRNGVLLDVPEASGLAHQRDLGARREADAVAALAPVQALQPADDLHPPGQPAVEDVRRAALRVAFHLDGEPAREAVLAMGGELRRPPRLAQERALAVRES